ncbi:hypothetical protein AYO38_02025 [bacterium SCGC AG-212-C10]|nr:hypothetical protein AYO38_02025 [bacterium SCGC AG-212-C10]
MPTGQPTTVPTATPAVSPPEGGISRAAVESCLADAGHIVTESGSVVSGAPGTGVIDASGTTTAPATDALVFVYASDGDAQAAADVLITLLPDTIRSANAVVTFRAGVNATFRESVLNCVTPE